MSGKRVDLVGKQYGRLTVVSFGHQKRVENGTRLYWNCKCECGALKRVCAARLRSGKAKSCGQCEKPGGNRISWPGYSSLRSAVARCYNPHNVAYANYGGRGTRICDRWLYGTGDSTGFECFFADMGPRPSLGHSLDRIDVNGDYEPGNCRWATKKVQQQNQRRAIYANIGGVNVPLKAYVARLGLCYETLRRKVRKLDMTVQQAARDTMRRSY